MAESDPIATRLGLWFDEHRRDLPWRQTRDPYSIWVSEIMLQQTRVQTVLAYYAPFLRRFPTIRALANAKLPDVLAAWSGLGYYRRARALHEGAKYVVERLEGELPADATLLRQIPGVGRYTAGAIASIAFGLREPLVDGNVARVLARLFDVRQDVRSAAGQRTLWKLATDLLPADRPGRHNEALMELGATVCVVGAPACTSCPLAGSCRALASGRERELPVVGQKGPIPTVPMVALWARRAGRVLLGRRGTSGLFGGLWEPPMVEVRRSEDAGRKLGELLGTSRLELVELGAQTHVLTHRKLEVVVATAKLGRSRLSPSPPYEQLAWHDAARLRRSALSSLARKVLALGETAAKSRS